MKMSSLWLKLVVVMMVVCLCTGAKKLPKKVDQPKPKPKPVKLNTDGLLTLPEILESLQMTKFVKNFIKMGVTETRLLLRLSSMDFRIMEIEWPEITKDEITKLKDTIAALVIQATVPEEAPQIDLSERSKQTYGKLYLPNSVQSYEYSLASFGKPPPIGKQIMTTLDHDEFGCLPPAADKDGSEYAGKTLLLKRGNCTFLVKAQNAKLRQATGLIIVNTEDRVESPSSGLGVDKHVTDAMVLALDPLFIVSVANTSWIKLEKALQFNAPAATYVSVVPLKCHSGGKCVPLVEEEKALQSEVSSGILRVKSTNSGEVKSFEFLTSNFGSQLPTASTLLPIVRADPIDACSSLVVNEKYTNAGVIVHRGTCRFDVKTLNTQAAGARFVIVVDVDDNALQRVGGMQPESGYVGIPSVIVTAAAGDFFTTHRTDDLVVEIIPSKDNIVSNAWIDLAFTEWNENESEQVLQLESLVQKYSQNGDAMASSSVEIVPWLKRRIQKITFPKHKSIDTDESESQGGREEL